MGKLLGIFAHPGDEVYFSGGTFLKYIKAGWSADLVCATRGLDEAQQTEMETAAGLLGVRSVTFLDYKVDGLAKQTPGEIEDKITKLLNEYRPDVTITYEPAGITNHPDHAKLSLASTFSFQKYSWDRQEENPEDKNPPKLYFVCIPETLISYFRKKKLIADELHGKRLDGIEDKKISTVIDIKRFKSAKASVMAAYSNHEGWETLFSLPNSPLFSQEYFIHRFSGTVEAFMGKNDRISDRI